VVEAVRGIQAGLARHRTSRLIQGDQDWNVPYYRTPSGAGRLSRVVSGRVVVWSLSVAIPFERVSAYPPQTTGLLTCPDLRTPQFQIRKGS
jgi:hypothetical protein